MKNLLFCLVAIVTLSFSANAQRYVEMQLPAFMKSNENARNSETIEQEFTFRNLRTGVEGRAKVKILVPDRGEGMISLAFTENYLQAGGIGADFYVRNASTAQSVMGDHNHGACIADCNKRYTDADGNKIPGRGWCKAGCWGKTAVQVAELVVQVAAVF